MDKYKKDTCERSQRRDATSSDLFLLSIYPTIRKL